MLWTLFCLAAGFLVGCLATKAPEGTLLLETEPLTDLVHLASFHQAAAKQIPTPLLNEETRWLLACTEGVAKKLEKQEDRNFIAQLLASSVRFVEEDMRPYRLARIDHGRVHGNGEAADALWERVAAERWPKV